MLVVVSRFKIASDRSAALRDAFRNRPHLVDRAPGFLGMEFMSPTDARDEIWLVTRWQDERSYADWYRGHDYHKSHAAIAEGLKLVPGSVTIRRFEVFAD